MGFETLKNILDFNKEQERLGRLEKENPTWCHYCEWELQVNSKGEKSCIVCGRIFR